MSFDPETPFQDLPPLPPRHEVETRPVLKAVVDAGRKLAALDMACRRMPDPSLLINITPILEAQASSEIENIVTTNDELFRAANAASDASETPAVKEALRYRSALFVGYQAILERPLSFQTSIAVCSELRGSDVQVRSLPGTFIGNPITRRRIYTPPEGRQVILEKLGAWESFLHDHGQIDPIVAMALLHYQFEAIHPFTDGNGRTGRILNLLCLKEFGLLDTPVLYLSGYFVRNKDQYYRLLHKVTEVGAWEEWILFVTTGISESASASLHLIDVVLEEHRHLDEQIRREHIRMPAADLAALLTRQPYVRIEHVVEDGLAQRATASRWLHELADAGLLSRQKIGRSMIFINSHLLSRLFTS